MVIQNITSPSFHNDKMFFIKTYTDMFTFFSLCTILGHIDLTLTYEELMCFL